MANNRSRRRTITFCEGNTDDDDDLKQDYFTSYSDVFIGADSALVTDTDSSQYEPNCPISNNETIGVGSTEVTFPSSSRNTEIQCGNNNRMPWEVLTKATKIEFKLRRLQHKANRYEEYNSFLKRCINEKAIPRGMELDIGPVIGNLDDRFVEMWYEVNDEARADFQWKLLKNTLDFCEHSITSVNTEIALTSELLKEASDGNSIDQ